MNDNSAVKFSETELEVSPLNSAKDLTNNSGN